MARKQTLVVLAAVLATIGIGTDVSVASAQTTAAATSSATVVASTLTVASPLTVAERTASAAVVASINHTRVSRGIPALWWGIRVTASAHGHNQWMAYDNTLSHQLPGEAPLGTRISAQGVAWTWVGENVGMAYSSQPTASALTAAALSLETMMMTEVETGHRANILSRNVFLVGVDVVYDTVSHWVWLTEDFAN